jgi:hypothetical protein
MEAPTCKKRYEPPMLEKVGNVKDLTLGAHGTTLDNGGAGSYVPTGVTGRAVATGDKVYTYASENQ